MITLWPWTSMQGGGGGMGSNASSRSRQLLSQLLWILHQARVGLSSRSHVSMMLVGLEVVRDQCGCPWELDTYSHDSLWFQNVLLVRFGLLHPHVMIIFLLQCLTLLTSGLDTGHRPSPMTNWLLDHWWPKSYNKSVFLSWWLCVSDGNLAARYIPLWVFRYILTKKLHIQIAQKSHGETILMQFWSFALYCSLGAIRGRKTNSCSLSLFLKSTATVALGLQESLILTQQNCMVGESREDSLPGRLFLQKRSENSTFESVHLIWDCMPSSFPNLLRATSSCSCRWLLTWYTRG